jgi:hypothetical protein
VTAATYEETSDMTLGNLIFVEYTNQADAQSQIAAHRARGEVLLLQGQAYIRNSPVNVLVFRKR